MQFDDDRLDSLNPLARLCEQFFFSAFNVALEQVNGSARSVFRENLVQAAYFYCGGHAYIL
jgi:hypothetical protein